MNGSFFIVYTPDLLGVGVLVFIEGPGVKN